jgi:hypothetical protein
MQRPKGQSLHWLTQAQAVELTQFDLDSLISPIQALYGPPPPLLPRGGSFLC